MCGLDVSVLAPLLPRREQVCEPGEGEGSGVAGAFVEPLLEAVLVGGVVVRCCTHALGRRPVLLRFPLHRRRVRVLALDPVRRAPRSIARVAALRHDAFEAELAGVLRTRAGLLSSRCSLNRRPDAARASRLASVALRTASGSRRRSSPSSSIRSKA